MNLVEAHAENGSKLIITAWRGPNLEPLSCDELQVILLECLLANNARELNRLQGEQKRLDSEIVTKTAEARRVSERMTTILQRHAHLFGDEDVK